MGHGSAAPVAVRLVVNVYFGMYRRIWRHASVAELLQVSIAVTAGSILAAGLYTVVLVPLNVPGTRDFSRSFWVIEGLVSLALLVAFDSDPCSGRRWRPAAKIATSRGVPRFLYAAGQAGIIVVKSARELGRVRPVGFLDDDDRLHGQTVAGLMVHRHAHLLERDAVEQDLHVLDGVDRHAGLADVADDARMVAS